MRHRWFILAVVVLLGTNACSLWSDDDEPGYRLRRGAIVQYPDPLPSLTPIYVDKTDDDGEVSSRLAFKAWDFNDDGRFDMVEVLDNNGALSERLFDLDFDGVIDFRRKMAPQASRAGNEAAPPPSLPAPGHH